MSCYRPVPARRSDNGSVMIHPPLGTADMQVPCGFCIGCMLERRQHWSLRCRHEASCWDHNVFLTLTYDDDHLEWHGSLNRSHPDDFLRSLRRKLPGVQNAPGSSRKPIRFFGCGEYGSQRQRAHYHLLLFNVQLPDHERCGERTYTSRLVSELWPFGSHLCGDVTAASASYVAGYTLKKVEAVHRDNQYGVANFDTGEYVMRDREFTMCSRHPGIGQFWYDKYKGDLRHGYIIDDGRQVSVPRAYVKKLRDDAPAIYEEMSWNKYQKGKSYDPADRSEARLAVREEVTSARHSFFSTSHLED